MYSPAKVVGLDDPGSLASKFRMDRTNLSLTDRGSYYKEFLWMATGSNLTCPATRHDKLT